MGTGNIAILGVFVADATFRAARMPAMGETLIGDSFALGPGGKGSNQAVAAARAGGDVHFITRLGRDTFGEMAETIWADAGVTPAVIYDDERATGAASIFVDATSGNNAIIICPGAAQAISPADVQANTDLISGARVFMTQLEQPVETAFEALKIARAGGATTILNPAPAAELPDGMIALCDYVTPNESEAEGLTGIRVARPDDANAAAQKLLEMGAGAVLITLGEMGAFFADGQTSLHVPALSAGPVVETTGAGDAFNGGFAAALAAGQPPAEAIRFATATAAISVTRPGTAPSMPAREEIFALLSNNGS